MNICFYTDYSISPMTGGIGRVTSVLTEWFRGKFGWKVYSIYAFDAKEDCLRTEVDGSICLRLHDRLNIRRDVKTNVKKASDFIRENQVDVVYVQTSMDVVAKLRPHVDACIVSVLHFEPGRDEWKWKGWGLATLRNAMIHYATVRAYRSAYEQGDFVSVLSPSYIKEYREYAGLKDTQKIVTLPNPLSFDVDSVNLEQKGRVALVVARMEEGQKRISHILRIWKKVDTEGWVLKIVGEGPSLSAYKSLAEELQINNVEFYGRQDPVPFYREAKLFLMTSSFEGFPMTLVEAQQFGCVPVVYDAFTALQDVVRNGENGVVVPNEDENVFADVMHKLMADEERLHALAVAAMADCGRFSQQRVCNEWKRILENLTK